MTKGKKVLIIILSVLAVLGVGAYTTLYILYPVHTPYFTQLVIDYICNKPLPVIGVSSLVLFFMIFKLVRFIIANKGRKYSELQSQITQLKNDLAQARDDAEKFKQIAYDLFEKGNENLKEVCDAMPNKKVKAIGEKIYGKKDDRSTETEGL